MLQVCPKRWGSWTFTVRNSLGADVGEIQLSPWRERGVVRAGGVDYPVGRDGLLGCFTLGAAETAPARAAKPSALRRVFLISAGGREWSLRPESALGRSFLLIDGDTQVGRVAPIRWWSRAVEADLPENLDLALRMFVVWLVLLMERRRQTSS